jgi:hypothetical protein
MRIVRRLLHCLGRSDLDHESREVELTLRPSLINERRITFSYIPVRSQEANGAGNIWEIDGKW